MSAAKQESCYYEERISNLERDVAELKARMDNKKEDIHDINKELQYDRKQQIELVEKVTEVTVLLKAGQEQRDANNEVNNQKFNDLEKKIDNLTDELDETKTQLTDTKEQLTDFVASQRSFRNTMTVGIQIAISFIVGILFHLLKI